MNIGFIGQRVHLAERLARAGFRVFATSPANGVVAMASAVAVAKALEAPRVTLLDLADGFATELAIQDVWPECAAGDVIVDLAFATANDGKRRASSLASVRMHFVDAALHGDRLYAGGDAPAIALVAPCFDALCQQWTHCGEPGSGYHAGINAGMGSVP